MLLPRSFLPDGCWHGDRLFQSSARAHQKNITDPRDYDEPVQDGRNEREEYGDEEIDAEDIGNDVL